ncbi:MAG: hypothetical protein A2X86_19970 [Bdellovibrionales bacterium GWA2_49_15]|nr:MAG: hypothetical protein A2X86_19970 [Bdellovibrionales bacterium GWA2_49_15]HAZ12538.1 hypothetical protein [Bdellovibrionales bacterium]
MWKPIHLLIVLLINCGGAVALAGADSNSAVVKVAIEDASAEAKVLGVETYYGLIVAAQKIKNVEKPKNVKAEEIKNSEILVLKNGRRIEVRDVEFLYVREVALTALKAEQGKHPNTDEGASGTH